MTPQELTYSTAEHRDRLIALALDGISSPHTRRAYGAAIDEFLTWSREEPVAFGKALVQRYKSWLLEKALAPASINQRLAAVRRLAEEAADNGLLDPRIAGAVRKVRGVRRQGTRLGHWLSSRSASELLSQPGPGTLKGMRDRALLSVLLGCGLRRGEGTALLFEHFRIIEGRWAIVDLEGKHGRIRTVPAPIWCKQAVDAWAERAGISEGFVFRRVGKNGRVSNCGISPQAVYNVVRSYVLKIDPFVSPHDLRRSFARLAHEGHAAIEQLSMTLGHASIATTERYVAAKQDFVHAPCDLIELDSYGA